jgi:hypothetical protein
MYYIETDHENPAVQALINTAAAVDDKLPAAWSRIAGYLSAYKEETGVLGRRKLDGDGNTAELRIEDLHILIGALETMLEAHTGPEEPAPAEFETVEFEEYGVGLADIAAKLDQILEHVSPLPTAIKYDLKSRPATGPLADGGVVINIQPDPSGGSGNDAFPAGYAAGVRAGRQRR